MVLSSHHEFLKCLTCHYLYSDFLFFACVTTPGPPLSVILCVTQLIELSPRFCSWVLLNMPPFKRLEISLCNGFAWYLHVVVSRVQVAVSALGH